MPNSQKEMPFERQWYLYEKMRPYCPENTADLACPEPEDPKPANPQVLSGAPGGADTAPDKHARPTCSHCKQAGHCRSGRGVLTCPLLRDT